MNKEHQCFLPILYMSLPLGAWQVILNCDQVKALTPNWKVDQSADERQRFLDKLMELIK